jgi:hypothetical protein
MDATQKRRMWKVTAGHFALTVFAVVLIFSIPFNPTSSFQDFRFSLGYTMFSLLQPQLYFASHACNLNSLSRLIWDIMFISVPTWSICFGWIFVKLDNWLNHFPVLGKRVF